MGDKDKIALFLIKEEREWVSRTTEVKEDVEPGKERRGGQQDTPSYNTWDRWGRSPIFFTRSRKIVEEMLTLDDLVVTTRGGKPLLWHCASKGFVSERVANDQKLVEQYGQRSKGRLPLEQGEFETIVVKLTC